jgi:alkanesulfonate monooxygenase SsuD/methylene tetrahydromethanopterin reductase-like flavin-dependent oxidoreductase (luciferase family)
MTGVRFGFKLSIHGQPEDVRFRDLLELAQHAEEAGFDGVFVVDHLLLPGSRLSGYTNADPAKPYFLDAWTSLAAIAAATRRVRVGPQVTPIGLRHPAFVAKWAMTVDQVSDGRLLLQVGAGHQRIEYESFGFPFPRLADRVARLREGIEVIRRFWESPEPVTYEGEHYQIRDVPFWPKPVQERPEIWLGGSSPAIRAMIPELADGWTPATPQGGGLDPAYFAAVLPELRAQLPPGRRLTAGAMFYTAIDKDPAVVEQRLEVLRRRTDWSTWPLSRFQETGIALAGTPEDVIRSIERYVAAGLEYVTVGFVPHDDLQATHDGIELYREHVLPHFAAGKSR